VTGLGDDSVRASGSTNAGIAAWQEEACVARTRIRAVLEEVFPTAFRRWQENGAARLRVVEFTWAEGFILVDGVGDFTLAELLPQPFRLGPAT